MNKIEYQKHLEAKREAQRLQILEARREAQRLELLKRELAKPTAERVRQLLK